MIVESLLGVRPRTRQHTIWAEAAPIAVTVQISACLPLVCQMLVHRARKLPCSRCVKLNTMGRPLFAYISIHQEPNATRNHRRRGD